ncbi:MAG: peptidoglycan-binding domain-containing protein [Rhodospirillales bacterium]
MIRHRIARNGLAALMGAALLVAAGSAETRAQDSTLLGAGAGAGGGAGIGFALGGPVGAVVGGLLGAGVGAGAGHAIGKDDKAREAAAANASGGGNLTAQVQQELIWAGYDAGAADGRYGPRTANAIRAYQANNGLAQDGQASPALLDHLRAKRGAATPQQAGYAPPPALPQAPPQAIDQSNCKPYETRTLIDGKEMVSKGTACLQKDGSWRTIN